MGIWNRMIRNCCRQWKMTILSIVMLFIALPAYSASKTILVLGDSLSAEYGLTRGTGWVPLLQRHLQAQHSSYQVINASISGDTTSSGSTRLAPLLTQHKPDIVIVELGSNDALRGLPLTMTRTNLNQMVKQSQASGAKVLLIGMQIPPNYGKTYTEAFNKIYSDIARQTQSALVPFFFEGIAGNLSLFQLDQLHPTEQAQPMLLKNVLPHLTPLLK